MRALIVEDEPAISRILMRKLSSIGLECKCTESVKESKNLINDFKPDVIFLDYVLSDGRSKELAVEGHLKEISQVFLMSAFMDDLEKKDFEGLNVTFLKKPFNDLQSVLDQVSVK